MPQGSARGSDGSSFFPCLSRNQYDQRRQHHQKVPYQGPAICLSHRGNGTGSPTPTSTRGRRWTWRRWNDIASRRNSIPTRNARQHPPHRFSQSKCAPISDMVVCLRGEITAQIVFIIRMHRWKNTENASVIGPAVRLAGFRRHPKPEYPRSRKESLHAILRNPVCARCFRWS